MPHRIRRPTRRRGPGRLSRPLIPVLFALGWLVAGASGAAAWGGTVRTDLYFAAGYEHQVDSRTCTAAATAMMMNFIAHRDLGLNQYSILRFEQARDALQNSVQRGSDPLGWSRATTYFSGHAGQPTTYAWEAYGSARAALRRAATQIAVTHKPVGLLVQHGTHAMVMTGFDASSDPARKASFTLYSVWISDPYGASHKAYPASSTPLNTYLQTDATPWYDAQWYGRYVIVVPRN
jgi:hypothetical protein